MVEPAGVDGVGEDTGVTSLVVRAVLAEVRHGENLHRALQAAAHPYLCELTHGETQEEVEAELPKTPDAWMETFCDAWLEATQKVLPKLLFTRAEVWSGATSGAPAAATIVPPQTGAGVAGAGGPSVPNRLPGTAMNDVQLAEMMDGLIVSDHDVSKAIADIQAQRISGARIMALSLALNSGHMHPAGESADLRYASDLRLCELIRKQRKAGVNSLDDVLKTKSRREIALHFTRLAKEYNDRKLIEEATLVSQFWAETSSAFEGYDANLVIYLTEWARKNSGRGIPKVLDTDLILRYRKTGGGSSSDDVKKIEDAVKKAEKELSKSEERNAALMKRLQRLEDTVKRNADRGQHGDGCFICGGDHLARDCPNKSGKGNGRAGKGRGRGNGGDADVPVVDITGE